MQGKTINGYTLKEKIGVGGMAEVWLAENSIGKKAAVKLLLPRFCGDEAIVTRFANEANVMVTLDHPNIRQVYDYCNLDGRPCILMEYLEGSDLKALLKKGRRFSDAELRKWWDQIADALNYTHAKGIVHRDIKPSNIFLDNRGDISLLDFGIAKIEESISLTQTGSLMGTLMYMSPEQVKDSKHIGPQTDAYSLAVTFVHLLTGKAPYDDTSSDDYTIRKGIVEMPLDLSPLPAVWRDFLTSYLAKNPDNRPALRPFATPLSERGGREADGERLEDKKDETPSPTKPKSKTGLWIGLGVALVIALAGDSDGAHVIAFLVALVTIILYLTQKGEPVPTATDKPVEAQQPPAEAQNKKEEVVKETKDVDPEGTFAQSEPIDPEGTIAQPEPEDPEGTIAQPEPIDPEGTVAQ